jgi:prefoldin alpha subunit
MQNQEAAEKVYQDWIQKVQYYEKLLENLDINSQNIDALKEQVKELELLKGDEEILAPVANGIFIKANLKDVKTLKVNVGKGIMLDKTIPETIELIEKQENEITLTREQVLHKLEELYEMAKEY